MRISSGLISLLALLLMNAGLSSCCRHAVPTTQAKAAVQPPAPSAGPPLIIYKTRQDYTQNVPVILSEDRKKVVSFPDVKDVYVNGTVAYPTLLHRGYLLDVRGIGPGVAFLKLTYEEYRKLGKTPSADELMNLVMDKDPLTEMFRCGTKYQYQDLEGDLNRMIDRDDFSKCVKLK